MRKIRWMGSELVYPFSGVLYTECTIFSLFINLSAHLDCLAVLRVRFVAPLRTLLPFRAIHIRLRSYLL